MLSGPDHQVDKASKALSDIIEATKQRGSGVLWVDLSPGTEAVKSGFIYCENQKGALSQFKLLLLGPILSIFGDEPLGCMSPSCSGMRRV